MALKMLLTFFLCLLHLLVGVCDADVVDDDSMRLTPFIYTNPYIVLSDSKAIIALAEQGKCMSLIGSTKATTKGLASCGLKCYLDQYNTWDVCNFPWSCEQFRGFQKSGHPKRNPLEARKR